VKKRLAAFALAGIAVYVAIDVALVFLRPQFSVLHNAESDYGSRGAYAWVMDANFLLRCAFSLAVVALLPERLRVSRALLVVWAVGSGLLAFFPDEPGGAAQTGSGKVHVALALVVFIAVIVGTRLASRALRDRTLVVLSWVAVVPLLLAGRTRFRPHALGGLYEKVFLAIELAWLAVAAARVAGWQFKASTRLPTASRQPV
jgi:hypothetical membrane protein